MIRERISKAESDKNQYNVHESADGNSSLNFSHLRSADDSVWHW